MTVARRTADEMDAMRRAGRVVAEMHERLAAAVRPGVTPQHLDRIAATVIEERGARSNFLGYRGYPAVICASPNDVVVHGIPGDTPLEEGDVISLDCGAIVDGYHGDAAWTHPVGTVEPASLHLLAVGEACLREAIDCLFDGVRLGDIGHAVQSHAEANGCSVVRDYTGHGIGRAMHEDPQIPNHGRPGRGLRLRTGNVVAIEPMVNLGAAGTVVDDDGWTVRTADGSRSAHFEHTIALGPDGPEILTDV